MTVAVRAALLVLLSAVAFVVFDARGPARAQEFPTTIQTFTNNTGAPANRLRVNMGQFSAALNPLTSNAPGCPQPTVYLDSVIPIGRYVLVWPAQCVDPGESVTLTFFPDCPCLPAPTVGSFFWSTTFATLTNSTGEPASAVHVVLTSPSHVEPPVTSPASCLPPAVTTGSPVPFTSLDVVWPSYCVGNGASVKLDMHQLPYLPFGGTFGPDSCASCSNPQVGSYTWTTIEPQVTPAPPTLTPAAVGGVVGLILGAPPGASSAAGSKDTPSVPASAAAAGLALVLILACGVYLMRPSVVRRRR